MCRFQGKKRTEDGSSMREGRRDKWKMTTGLSTENDWK